MKCKPAKTKNLQNEEKSKNVINGEYNLKNLSTMQEFLNGKGNYVSRAKYLILIVHIYWL
jgi:hypothetical protein